MILEGSTDMEMNKSSNSTEVATGNTDIFCTETPAGTLVWVSFSVACACVGMPASLCLLWVLAQRKTWLVDIFIVSITFMGLMYNILKIPICVNFVYWHNRTFLNVSYFMEGFNFNGWPLFMMCICVDCYMAVAHPITYMKVKNSRYRVVVCVLVWMAILLYNSYGFCRQFIHISVRGLFRLLIISTIMFCDIAILCALKKPDPTGRNNTNPQKRRAVQTITNSFVMTMVSYLPQMLISLLTPVIPLSQLEVWCSVLVPSLISSAIITTLMPLLYLGNMGGLKHLGIAGCARNVGINE